MSARREKTPNRWTISAGKAVAEAIRTTLGPQCMDKMLVDDVGDVVITNDGVIILDDIVIEHPVAEMIVEVAEALEDETGDGNTIAVVIAGELREEAETFLDQDIHPQTILRRYSTRLSQPARSVCTGSSVIYPCPRGRSRQDGNRQTLSKGSTTARIAATRDWIQPTSDTPIGSSYMRWKRRLISLNRRTSAVGKTLREHRLAQTQL